MIQKFINRAVWVLILLSALGGIASIVRLFGSVEEVDMRFASEQALAERVTMSYLSYDNERVKEKIEQLSMYPDEISKQLAVTSDAVQSVLSVTALEPIELNENRLKVPVDTWVLVTKKKDEKETELSTRRLLVTVFLRKDGDSSTILGLPVIEPKQAEKATMHDRIGESVKTEEQSIIEPVVKAFLNDYYSSTDPLALQNSLAAGVTIIPMSGQFEFLELKSGEYFSQGEDQYFAVCHVLIKDPVLDITLLTQVRIGLAKVQEKFYISSINAG